jgi:tetratricopeptide (TPR) repeat protein
MQSMTASRLQALDPAAVQCVVATAQALGMGRIDQAEARLRPLLDSHPDHPEVLRLYAGILSSRGNHTGALAAMRRAVAQRPSDPLFYNTLGSVLGDMGDFDAAIDALRRACGLQPGLAVAWYNLGVMLTRCVRNTEAAGVIRRAVALAPGNMDARALLGDLLRMQGDAAASAIEYRKVLSEHPFSGMAWWGLADLRTGAFEPGDIERMHAALRDSRASDDDRIAIGFAQARALDEAGRRDEALDALAHANAVARSRQRWDASGFSVGIDQANRSFTPPPVGAATSRLGHEVVFIVGIPRSGTTLVEQILASHSLIEGAGELPDLPLVLAEESRHRGQPFPNWVAAMNPADWQRLGERYLDRTAYWRRERPGFTDKLPNNWMYMGAIRAMLPGAHIVVCRRDPLETCFSCYRQHFANNEYTRTFEDLAAFWRDFDRTAKHFADLHPAYIYQHQHAALIADPEQSIRKLLDACDLPFEAACLRFHETAREVRSPSATQVREPLRRDTAHAQRYGALLDPLRKALGLPASGS